MAAAREIIERSGKVTAYLAGHTHWNARNTIDGVHDITIHSLTGSFTTYPHPTGALGILAIDNALTVEVFGRDRCQTIRTDSTELTPPGIGLRMARVIRL